MVLSCFFFFLNKTQVQKIAQNQMFSSVDPPLKENIPGQEIHLASLNLRGREPHSSS